MATVVALAGLVIARVATQVATITVPEEVLREYTGMYEWEPDAFVSLQLWTELSAKPELVAVDESGELRTLYPTERDRFFAGPGAAVPGKVESRIEFDRDAAGQIALLRWRRGDAVRVARRVDSETREDVRFASGELQLAGTLIAPKTRGRHPAVILVHGSGPQNRESILPYARFLVRRGIAVLGYDKRGVGASTGDWNQASFDDLATDVVAAFSYLKTRSDIDPSQVGMLGISQAGWVMPLAAVRAPDLAFLISVSGAAVPAAETTLDHAANEMTANGMKPEMIQQILGLMKAQYQFARTGQGWDDYLAAREGVAARLGKPPASFPAAPDHPTWQDMRRLYFYDPAPTLRQMKTPTLALFGALDNNIVAAKNRAAWQAALEAGGHRDFTLEVLPQANHIQLEAKSGHNAEMTSLQRFVPAYSSTVREWLAKRLRVPATPK